MEKRKLTADDRKKCAVCGRMKANSKHIKYGPDLDNPVKHEFVEMVARKHG